MKEFLTPVFVGRNKEISQLATSLAVVQGGDRRCVLVSGEAGIGKSRLIAEIRTQAANCGFTTLTGRCFEQDRAYPYASLIEILLSVWDRHRREAHRPGAIQIPG
jgi:predicted ATPase